VFAVLAVSCWIEARTGLSTALEFTRRRQGWPIRKIVKTARRYRTIQIQAGRQTSPPPTPGG
jgi:hypothetical protein